MSYHIKLSFAKSCTPTFPTIALSTRKTRTKKFWPQCKSLDTRSKNSQTQSLVLESNWESRKKHIDRAHRRPPPLTIHVAQPTAEKLVDFKITHSHNLITHLLYNVRPQMAKCGPAAFSTLLNPFAGSGAVSITLVVRVRESRKYLHDGAEELNCNAILLKNEYLLFTCIN